MADRNNWEREHMRDRGRDGNRENWDRGRDDWRDNEWDRERYSTAEERNRPAGQEGAQGYGSEDWYRNNDRGQGYRENRQASENFRGGYGSGQGATENRWNEGRGYEGSRSGQGQRGFEGSREGWDRGNEASRRSSYGNEGQRDYRRGDYGPGEFTRQFRTGTEYFGTGQRGYGTTWGGAGGYSGMGDASGYTGGIGTYGEQGRHAGRGPKGYQRSDDRIREDICERLTRHPEIDASEIDIQVKDGEVTLVGTVERREMKRMAEDVAEEVSGVKDVHNQLRAQSHQGANAGQGTQGNQAQREPATSHKNK